MTAGGSDASANAAGGIEQWDLTDAVSPYLDRHMIFPLLEFVDERIAAKAVSYDSRDVAEARLALLRPTHMVDYAVDVYRSIHGEAEHSQRFCGAKGARLPGARGPPRPVRAAGQARQRRRGAGELYYYYAAAAVGAVDD